MASSLRPLTRLLLARPTLLPRRTLTTLHLTSRRPLPTPRLHPTSLIPRRSMFIQTESTPNPDALKFIPGTPVLPAGHSSLEFLDGRETHSSPLARKLFAVDGVRAVFYGPDFITVTKAGDAQWGFLKPEVFSLITEALANGATGQVVVEGGSSMAADTAPADGDSEVVAMVKELLDTRIRPAIMEDGGDIEFRGFDEAKGEVKLKLRGACRTCDSSAVTLKNGIESMLMHYIDEVKMVTQVLDREEEVAVEEFEKFEEKLRRVRGGEGPVGL
ncbi:scaffold protein Nfu/NifU N terminal-domain-containing protein [Geopyxis carbonaria]|nr:scaffold protein Nfu/NifU N terminal-domain-containing protein [Geopyxis carbonaria]